MGVERTHMVVKVQGSALSAIGIIILWKHAIKSIEPSVNASSHATYKAKPMPNVVEASPSVPNTSITQEQYIHLVSSLQQSSLAPSTSPFASSNLVTSHPATHS